jgi:hypothetical protein
MVAHSPSQLPVVANVRFTEDSQELKLGDGLWKTVTGKGNFRQDYVDQSRQIAASHVELFEDRTRVFYSVALHIAKRKIGGIETIVYRVPADAKSKPDQLGKPLPGMNDPVPAGKGMSRADLVRIAKIYKEGLRIGGFVKANTPFAPEAYRVENGVRTAGEGCTGNPNCVIGTQKMLLHPDIEPSVVAVDEQGAASAGAKMSFFRHKEIFRSNADSFQSGETAETASPAHRLDESPAGYSSAGWSPPEPASASPTEDHSEGERAV